MKRNKRNKFMRALAVLMSVALVLGSPLTHLRGAVLTVRAEEAPSEVTGTDTGSGEQNTGQTAVIKYGKVDAITNSATPATVEGSETAEVKVSSPQLSWYEANPSVGRSVNGWWVGIKITAPADMVTKGEFVEDDNEDVAANIDPTKVVTYKRNGSYVGNFWKAQDSNKNTDSESRWMQMWGCVTPEYIKNAIDNGDNIVYTWEFDWNRDGNYEQKVTLSIDPAGVVLMPKSGTGAVTVNASTLAFTAPSSLIADDTAKTASFTATEDSAASGPGISILPVYYDASGKRISAPTTAGTYTVKAKVLKKVEGNSDGWATALITGDSWTFTIANPSSGSNDNSGGSSGGSSGGGSGSSGGSGTKPTPTPTPTPTPVVPAATTTADGTTVTLNKDGAYVDKNGKTVSDTLIKEPSGTMHVTDSTGHIVKDSVVTAADGKTYVVAATGNVVTSDIAEIKGNKYVADEKGQLVTESFSTIGGELYYSDAEGLVKTDGLFSASGKKYYANEDGTIAVKELITVDGKKYFATKTGAIATKKIVKADGKKYFATKSGAIATNKIVKTDGKKYFATKSGKLATNKWVKVGNKKYFCNKNGVITKTKKVK